MKKLILVLLVLLSTNLNAQSLWDSITREQWDVLYCEWMFINHHILTKGFELSNTKAALICFSITAIKEFGDELAYNKLIDKKSIVFDGYIGASLKDAKMTTIGTLSSVLLNVCIDKLKKPKIVERRLPSIRITNNIINIDWVF